MTSYATVRFNRILIDYKKINRTISLTINRLINR